MSNPSQSPDKKRVSLLAYWTWRYVLVLLGVLMLIGVSSGFWLRYNAYEQSYELLEVRAAQAAEAYEMFSENNTTFDKIRHLKEMRAGSFLIQIADEHNASQVLMTGKLVDRKDPLPIPDSLLQKVRNGESVREDVSADGKKWLLVGVPIKQQGKQDKVLIVALPAHDALPQSKIPYGLLSLLIGSTALVGLFFIYFLSRKLTDPLLQVARAAQKVSEGNYHQLDLPEQVKEKELQQLVGSFQHMALRLSQLEKLRTELLAGVSHELRTPITSIRGMIQAVRDNVVTDEEAEEFLHISLKETERLQTMVEDLLNLSSFEAGSVPVAMERVDIAKLIDEVIHQLRILPKFAQVDFDVVLPPSVIITNGDPGLLRQILLNLFNNSREAAHEQAQITVRGETTAGQLSLYVQDYGRGIPEEDQPFIFERFYRGPSGRTKSHGLGLGLTISKLLAQAHGGDLALHESSAAGTTFRLSLPVHDR